MPNARCCERCGAALTASALQGLCPSCMLRDGLGLDPADGEPAAPAQPAADRQETSPPRFVGNYELLHELGRGGMGVVYLAEQKEPVRRRVALKIIKLGMDTQQVIARFEAERQALALMDHPNVAKVLDAGATDTGRPFFVMELVRGVKITQYCDENKLPTAERLNLFVQVCRAIQHAHQKGVIHRDIKPSNILVTVQDGVPVPKVIDFGVAKATGASLTDKTVFTAFEQLLGTPAYMSPEQAQAGGFDIDTRSDIYSLGVLLYELLTGGTPFDSAELLSAGLDAMRRKIREVDPPRPSTRLTSLTNEEVASVAKQRRAEPPRLISLVRGDLDWIVMKALEKERARRYETANGLAMDVQRYLNDEAIVARPAGTGYRLRKWLRRNKATAAAAAAVSGALMIGAVVSGWQAALALRSRNQAQASERKAQHISQFLTGMFQSIDPAVAKLHEITVREILDEAARTVGTSFSNEPMTELAMRRTLIDIYGKLGRDDQALPQAEAALRLAEKTRGGGEPVELAECLNELGLSLDALGRSAEALPRYEAALAMFQRIHKHDHADIATTLNYLALCLNSLGRPTEALPKSQAALAMFQRLHPGDNPEVAEGLNNLASCQANLGQSAAALANYEASLAMRQRIHQGDHPDVLTGLENVATCLDTMGRGTEALTNYEAALAMSRRIYKGDHPYLAISLNNVAACLQGLGRASEALPKYKETLAMRQRLYGGDHPYVANGLNNLASCLEALGRQAEARPKLEAALAMYQRIYPGDHPSVAGALDKLGGCLDAMGNSAEALPMFEAALAMRQRLFHGDHPQVASSLNSLASCLNSLGRSAEALPKFEAALAMFQRVYPGDHPQVAASLHNLADCLNSRGRSIDALAKYQAALAMFQRIYHADHPALGVCRANLAFCLDSIGCAAEAATNYDLAIAMEQRIYHGDHPDLVTGLNNLALCLQHLGRPTESLARLEAALEMSRRLFPGDHPYLAGGLQNLGFGLSVLARKTEALQKYQESIEIFERLAAEQPESNSVRTGLAKSCERLGDLLQSMGRTEEARANFERGLKAAESALAASPADPQAEQLCLGLRVRLGLDTAEVAIAGVAPGRRGEQLGLQPGDVMIGFRGERIISTEQWRLIAGKESGTPGELEIRRGDRPLKLSTKLDGLGVLCVDRRSLATKPN